MKKNLIFEKNMTTMLLINFTFLSDEGRFIEQVVGIP